MATTKHSGDSASRTHPKEAHRRQGTSDRAKPIELGETARIAHALAHFRSAKALTQMVRELVMEEEDQNRPDTANLAIALESAEVHIRQVTDTEANLIEGGHLFDGNESRALAIITVVNAWLSGNDWSHIPDDDRLIAALGSLEMFIERCIACIAPTSGMHMALEADRMLHPLAPPSPNHTATARRILNHTVMQPSH